MVKTLHLKFYNKKKTNELKIENRRKDGARLSVGTVCGAVLNFESVIRRTIWQDKFEITFVAPSQVLLKSLQDSSNTMIVESQLGLEIDDVRIMGKI